MQVEVNNSIQVKEEESKAEESTQKEKERPQGKEHVEKGEIKMPAKANETPGKKKNMHVPANSTCKCSIF